ncbi:MAG: DUF2971 domain-containing protein [Longimicrobiales bacterium]
MTARLLYKYRSLDNWKFVLDILMNRRLYAASFETLNDPMEGRYVYFGDEVSRQFRRAIVERQANWRICSLSCESRNTLMWSYYAAGHRGIALGVRVRPPASGSIQVRPVRYDSECHIDSSKSDRPADDVAIDILTQKQLAWRHEQEFRVFSSAPFVRVTVREIVLGCLVDPSDRELITKVARRFLPKVRIVRLDRTDLDAPERIPSVSG